MRGHAVVVGAGVGGLSTAIGLHRQGWEVEILERADRVQVLGTAFGIWPPAQEVLERLGLGESVADRSVPGRSGVLRDVRGRRLARISVDGLERRTGRPLVMLSRSELLQTLLDALPTGMLCTGRPVSAESDLPRDADLVVGADGLRSRVRELFFDGRSRPCYSGLLAFRGTVAGEHAPYGEVWHGGTIFGVTPLSPGRTNWYAATRADATTRLGLDDLRRELADWPEPVPAILRAVPAEDVLRHLVHDLRPAMSSQVSRRVALVGDAAHAMTPHLGQGACQALLDADALTRALAESADVPTALARYDRERNRAGRRYAAGSRAVSRLAHASAAAPPRDVVLRGIGALMQRRPVLSAVPTNTPRRWPGRASPTGSGRPRSPARHR